MRVVEFSYQQILVELRAINTARPALDVALVATFYMAEGHRSAVRDAMVTALSRYRAWVGDHLRWGRSPVTHHYMPIGDDKLPSASACFSRSPDGNPSAIEYRGGDHPWAADPFQVEAYAPPEPWGDLSYFRMTLPVQWFADDPTSFAVVVNELANLLSPLHGYAGIGLVESGNRGVRVEHEPAVFALAKRFPGLEVDVPSTHSLYLRRAIKGVNWLTMLDLTLLSQLGGKARLDEELDDRFVFRHYPGGVIIQSGPRPEIGDRELGIMPRTYVELAKLLAPIQVSRHQAFHHGGPGERFNRENSERWLFRFREHADDCCQ